MRVTEVQAPGYSLDRFAEVVGTERLAAFQDDARRTRRIVGDRTIWNISSTAAGGGVSEMLHVLVAYARGAGADVRWLVMGGDPAFFTLTKRIHHLLHGRSGDGRGLGPDEHDLYREVSRQNADQIAELVQPGDVVIAHDPQPAGLLAVLGARGAKVIWRCHIGTDRQNEHTERGWDFLGPYVRAADAYVFSRKSYVPDVLNGSRVHIVHPSIDPFSPKNVDLEPSDVHGILARIGLLQPGGAIQARYARADGSLGHVARHATIVSDTAPLPTSARTVAQVSRWDPLKDMLGVMRGFTEHLADHDDTHLLLVGPDVAGVTDDPEGAEVLSECVDHWHHLPSEVRRRVHVVSLPMDDLEENAAMVNAVQRHASVVVQKSLVEGFGLTVAEAMWKARPVVASAIGGILDQIVDGDSGLLVDDPTDLAEFARTLDRVLRDDDLATRLGTAARERVREHFTGVRHLGQYLDILTELINGPPPSIE